MAETPTWRQQLRHFEKHKKQKKMDHVRDAIAALSTYDMVGAPNEASTRVLLAARSVSSGASSPAARRRAVSKRRFRLVPGRGCYGASLLGLVGGAPG